MNYEYVGWGLLAVAIAVLLSTVELFTRYQMRGVLEIVNSRFFVAFCVLNGVACFLVYAALPYLTDIVVKVELADAVDKGLVRAISAGLGYLVIARTSMLDITTKEGNSYGAGFDVIYNGLANFILGHHKRQLRKKLRIGFHNVFDVSNPHEEQVFEAAIQQLQTQVTGTELTTLTARMSLAKTNRQQHAEVTSTYLPYCLSLYLIIRDETPSEDDAAALLAQERNRLKANPPRTQAPQEQLLPMEQQHETQPAQQAPPEQQDQAAPPAQ